MHEINIIQFISGLNDKGIRITLKGDDLDVKAPKGVMTKEIIAELTSRKSELIEFLSNGYVEQSDILPVENAENYPISDAQRRLWVLSQFEKGSIAYNIPGRAYLNQSIDVDCFIKAVDALIDRHEILRTIFKEDEHGDLKQWIVNGEDLGFKIDYVDFRNESNKEESTQSYINQDSQKAFNLEDGPLLRAALLQVEEDEYVFYYNMHHIISDGWSQEVLTKDVLTYYDAFKEKRNPELKELPIQYKDYTVWQLNQFEKDAFIKHRDFWLENLAGDLPLLDLPGMKKRPKLKTYSGHSLSALVDSQTLLALKKFTQKNGGSLFMGLLATWNCLMYRYTSKTDIVIGSPIAGREHSDLESQIGFYVNTLAFRNEINPEESFSSFYRKVCERTLRCFDHQMYPFDRLVEDLNLQRDTSRNPVFDTMLTLQSNPEKGQGLELENDELSQILDRGSRMSKFDMSIDFEEFGDLLSLELVFNPDVYEQETMIGLITHFKQLLVSLIGNPDQKIVEIDYLSVTEKNDLLFTFNDTETAYPKDKTIVDLLEDQAAKTPDNVAVVFEDRKLSYRELHEQSNQLAHYLQKHYDIQPEDLVGIKLERSEWMMISILGVLKAGGAYVPIDPEYPQERIDAILNDSQCKAVVDQNELSKFKETQQEYSVDTLTITTKPNNLAYVIYTSGSTGKPKGVLLEHQGLINRLHWMQRDLNVTESDVFLQKTPTTFDVSVWELFLPLISGSTLVVAVPDGHKDPLYLEEVIVSNDISLIHFVPSMLSLALEAVNWEKVKSLRHVVCSGEALPKKTEEIFKSKLPSTSLHNYYGPTEATVDVTAIDLSKFPTKGDEVSIGKPVDNTQIYIVNDQLGIQPIGIYGELLIGGDQVARGYLNREELTKEKFIASPFREGERLYKTGDIARWLVDGKIEFQGRKDDQVKIRGNRIELGEIQHTLASYEAITQAVVLAKENEHGEKELVAYLTAQEEQNTGDLRSYLKESLPEYMLPAHFVQLDEMPLTPNGKIDKKSLPDPEGLGMTSGVEYIAPRNEMEEKLVALWEEVLQKEAIGIKDDFFTLGGHSLKAIRLINNYQKEFEVKLSINDLFVNTSIESHAELLSSSNSTAFVQIERQAEQESYPISDAQRRLWVLSQFEGGLTAYNMPSSITLTGEYDIPCFKKAIKATIERHEILRTIFKEDEKGDVRQWVLSSDDLGFEFDLLDLRNEVDKAKAVDAYLNEDSDKAFDLEKGPLLRAALLQTDDNEYVFYYNMHHIISDGWSMEVLSKDVFAYYMAFVENREPELNPLRIQYKDYAVWRMNQLEDESFETHKDYWLESLSGELPVLEMPAAKLKPSVRTGEGLGLRAYIDSKTTAKLLTFSNEQGGSLFMTLLAAWNVLMYKYTSQNDIIIGTTVGGREHSELEDQIGFYVNTLALRNELSPNERFNEFYQRVKETTLKSYEHQVYPFDRLVEELGIQRDVDRNSVFDVMLTLQNADENRANFELTEEEANQIIEVGACVSKFDLDISFREEGNHLFIHLEYRTDIYDRRLIDALLGHYRQLLNLLMDQPELSLSELDYLSGSEKLELQHKFNQGEVHFPKDKTVVDLFCENAKRNPEKLAAVFENTTLSYQQLDERSNQLANYLCENYQIEPNDFVAIKQDRSEWMLISIWAVLKSGAAYVPIDPNLPQSRIDHIENDAQSKVCIDEVELEAFRSSQEQYSNLSLTKRVGTEDLAYVIYTSGSTGMPKGIAISHQNLINKLHEEQTVLAFGDEMVTYAITNYAFDVSLLELVLPLIMNGKVLIPGPNDLSDGITVLEQMIKHRVSVLQGTPSYFNYLFSELTKEAASELNDSLRTICIGGESLNSNLVSTIKEQLPSVRVNNHYGPTEITIDAIVNADINSFESNTIGKPLGNTKVYIVDELDNLVPVFVSGEIAIAGPSVAKNYLNQEALTEEKFVENPFVHGGKMYKTGDLGRWMPNGEIEFIGRKDSQVKIRGYRIELGEIESTIGKYENVESAFVTTYGEEADKKLLAYVVPKRSEREFFWPSVGEYPVYDDYLYNAMTTDENRTKKYVNAINKLVKGKTVLDIGTGMDFILSKFCVDAGAKKVYAIEMDKEAYEKAKSSIVKLGLENKIEVIYGSSMEVELPELVDVCVSEIIGTIGGSEGVSAMLNNAQRFLKEDGLMIPQRCASYIAAVNLPDHLNESPGFNELGNTYMDEIFNQIGKEFRIRLCLNNVNTSCIISSREIVEDLIFDGNALEEFETKVTLDVIESGRFDGLLLWLNLFTSPDDVIDTLNEKTTWLPVYFPIYHPGIEVNAGDEIKVQFSARLSENGLNPDYFIKGKLLRASGEEFDFEFDSTYLGESEHESPFYDKLLEQRKQGLVYEDKEVQIFDQLNAYLKDLLPAYMVPSKFHSIKEMPLTSNGKVDKKALPDPQGIELKSAEAYAAPKTDREKVMVSVWSDVLKRERIGIRDSFYNLGGDSIKSIQVVSRLKRQGFSLKVEQILRTPILEELALLMEDTVHFADQSEVSGQVELTPIQHWLFEDQEINVPHHYNQVVVLKSKDSIDLDALEKSVEALTVHHDALRMVYKNSEEGAWEQWNRDTKSQGYTLATHDLRESGNPLEQMQEIGEKLQSSINLSEGPLLRAVHFKLVDGDRIGLIIHHLVVDGVSWRILLEDLGSLYSAYVVGQKVDLALKTDSFQKWSTLQKKYAQSNEIEAERGYWQGVCQQEITPLPKDKESHAKQVMIDSSESFYLDQAATELLQTEVHSVYNTEINDVLLTSLALALKETFSRDKSVLTMEGHGREEIIGDVDISRTVGWFTTMYPFVLDVSEATSPEDSLVRVKESLRRIPNKGIGYGMLKYLSKQRLENQLDAEIVFNYLGDFGSTAGDSGTSVFEYSSENIGANSASDNVSSAVLDISGMLVKGELGLSINYSSELYDRATITQLIQSFEKNLRSIIVELAKKEESHVTPSDLSFSGLALEELSELNADNSLEDVYELSPLQEGMYFHWLSENSSSLYFEQTSYRVKAKGLKMDSLKHAYDSLISRHGVLRTSFSNEYTGRTLQIVRKEVPSNFSFEIVGDRQIEDKHAYVESVLQKDIESGFDLTSPSQMRMHVIDLGDDTYQFIWSHHHILMDGWCVSVLINDFNQILGAEMIGEVPELPQAIPYSNYINWLKAVNTENSLGYWKEYLANYNEVSAVPFGLNTENEAYVRHSESLSIEGSLFDKMDALCNQLGITQNTFTQAVWGYLLSCYNATNDVVFGTVVSGRPASLKGVEDMIGLFINTIPVRVKYEADGTPIQLLKALHEESITATTHHYVNLSDVQAQSNLGMNLINHIMQFQNYAVKDVGSDGNLDPQTDGSLSVESMDVIEQNNYDLTILVGPSPTGLNIEIVYNGNRYHAPSMQRLSVHFGNLIREFSEKFDQTFQSISFLSDSEQENLLAGLTENEVAYPKDKTLVDLFEEQCAETPDNVAVTFEDKALTYRELDEQSNQLAHYLQKNNDIQPDDLIGIKLQRSEWTVISMLGILKIGGAYVPIDPDYPQERIDFIENDSACKVCIDEEELLAFRKLQNDYSKDQLTSNIEPHNLAYVIYTSGSTGNPKGALVEHGNLVRLFKTEMPLFDFNSHDVWTMFHSSSFDFSVWEMYGALLFGGKLVVVPKRVAQDTGSYRELLQREGVTILNQTPSAFYNLSKEEEAQSSADLKVRYVIFGGEALSPGRLQDWNNRYPTSKLINMYGITETTVHTTYKEITQEEISLNQSNIGKAIPTVSCIVLDEHQNIVPLGVTGELYVGGAGVVRGYLNQPSLSAERFITNPFVEGERLYRTGDKAKQLPNGDFEYLGRVDDQVKIRGHRIELGEIEHALLTSEGIEDAVVIARADAEGEKELVAYLTSKEEQNTSDLRAYLSGVLPEYMLPSYFVQLEAMPLTSNGKTDKKALPDPKGMGLSSGVEYVAPRNEIEEKLVGIWAEVLQRENIGVKDNFFELGGHSLKAVKVVSSVNMEFKTGLKIANMFTASTIEDLAFNIEFALNQQNLRQNIKAHKEIEL